MPTPKTKTQIKLPDLKPKKNPRGGGFNTRTTGFNDNITLVRGPR